MTFARAVGPTERERERCGGLALGPSGGGKVVVGIRESGRRRGDKQGGGLRREGAGRMDGL